MSEQPDLLVPQDAIEEPAQAPVAAPPTPLTRLRIHHARGAEMRYVGNLDMQLVWERTIRRAGLPIAFSQGFSEGDSFQRSALTSAVGFNGSSHKGILPISRNSRSWTKPLCENGFGNPKTNIHPDSMLRSSASCPRIGNTP